MFVIHAGRRSLWASNRTTSFSHLNVPPGNNNGRCGRHMQNNRDQNGDSPLPKSAEILTSVRRNPKGETKDGTIRS